jgi:hypothetical protein
MTLREVFHLTKRGTLPKQWCYLPVDLEWTLDTEVRLLDPKDVEESADEDLDPLALPPILLEAVVSIADRWAGREDDSARLEVISYNRRFGGFPSKLGAPDPPPEGEDDLQDDLKFYGSLGPEVLGTKCRKEGCARGTVKFSVFCRTHHFENVKLRKCPFQH